MATDSSDYSPGGSKSSFVIPKKSDTSRLYRNVELSSREFQNELYPAIRRSFRLNDSESRFNITRVQIVRNQQALERYTIRKEAMKDGKTEKELGESVAFLGCKSEQVCNKICSEGIRVGNVQYTMLGQAKMGVCVQKHADILWMRRLDTHQTYHMIAFKILKGRVKTVVGNCSTLEPTPNFDCHVPANVNSPNLNDLKSLYNASQIYLYEYGDLGVKDKPGQICPFAIVHYELKDPSSILPMKMSALVSPALPPSVSIWDGKLYNKDNMICAASLMSFGMMYKPTRLGLKINLQCTISCQEFKDKYMRNITEISIRQEIHNGQTYLSYFLLQARDNPNFDKLRKWLEKTEKLAVWYCGTRVDGILLPPTSQVTALGFPVVPNPEKCLHCVFASPYSLSSRLAMARDRLTKAQQSVNQTLAGSSSVAFSTNQLAASRTVVSNTNYDEGYLPTFPSKWFIRSQSVQAAFRTQFASMQTVCPPVKPTAPTNRNPKPFKPPPPANLPPSKFDPRMRRTSTTSTSAPADNAVHTNPPPEKPASESSAVSSETIKHSTHDVHRQQKFDELDSCLTPYSPTQFSPLDSAEALDTENDLNSSNRVHLPKLRLLSAEQNNGDAKRDETLTSLQNNVLGTLTDVVEAAGTKQASLTSFLQGTQVKRTTLSKHAPKPVQQSSITVESSNDCDFLDRVGRWQANTEAEHSIPFLDNSVKNGLNNGINKHRSSCGQSVTYGSIHSIDAMKSYLNASINRTAKVMAKVREKGGSVSEGNTDLPDETLTIAQPASNKLTKSDQLDSDTNVEGAMVAEKRLNSTASGEVCNTSSMKPGTHDIKNGDSSADHSSLKRKSIDSVDESFNSGKRLKPTQSVRVIPLENSTTSVKDPRLAAKMVGNQSKSAPEPREVNETTTNTSADPIDKTVTNAIKEFHAIETNVVKTNCDSIGNNINSVPWVHEQASESAGLMDDMDFETHTQEMKNRWKQLNTFKLSSFTTIFNQENEKVKVQPEKLEELKDKVMTFTEELMNRVAKTSPNNGLVNGDENGATELAENEHEILKNSEEIVKEEDLDCTQEIMSDEMDKFYVELAKIIPLEKDYIRSLMETRAKTKPLECGVLSKLKCMAHVLNESLSDKYMKCMLKCELKKFLMLVENLFTSIFIISESGSGWNNHVINGSVKVDDTSQRLLGQRYTDFKCALRKLMTSYGLHLNADGETDDISANVSILERLNEPNLHVDTIINEKHEEMTKILDDILDGKNSKNLRTSSAPKFAISSNMSANGKQLVLQYKPQFTDFPTAGIENGIASGGRQIEIKITNAPSSSTPAASRHVTNLADFIASQTIMTETQPSATQQNSTNDITTDQPQINLSDGGGRYVSDSVADEPPCSSTPLKFQPGSNTKDETSQSQGVHTKRGGLLRRKANQARNLSRTLRRYVLKKGDKPKDSSRCYAQFKRHLLNYQLVAEKQKSTMNSSFANRSVSRNWTGRIRKKVKKQQQLQNTLFHMSSAFSDICSSTPKQMTKMLAAHGSNLGTLLKGLAEDVDKLVKPLSSIKKRKKRTVKKKCSQDIPMESLSTVPYEDGYFDESVNVIIPNYLNSDGTSTGLYFVYGSDVDACNPVKSYLLSLGHRPYGSNNRETVLAAEAGEPLYVFLHAAILSTPHCIPDLVALKHMPNSHFYSFENETDLQEEKCSVLFPAGGVFIPDLKAVTETTPDQLTTILSALMSRPDWIILVHNYIVQHLEKASDEKSEGYNEHASELLNIINTSQLRGLGVMDSHNCDDKSEVCAVECLRNVQLDELRTRRHIVFVSDVTCLDSLYTELQLSGIGLTSLNDLKSRYLDTPAYG